MAKKYVIGLDSGTSVVKAVLFDLEGTEIATAARTTPVEELHFGWSEFDIDIEWREISQAFKDLLAKTGISPDEIGAIGICAKHGSCFLDENHHPVRLGILWNDGRCAKDLEEWDAAGKLDATFAETSNWLMTSDRNFLLPWLRRNEPGLLEKVTTVCSPANWVSVNLTGNFGANASDFYAQVDDTGQISTKVLQIAEIEDLMDKFPEIGEPSRIIGTVTERAAEQCGLVAGIPVAEIGWDAMSSTAGGGATEPGQANIILGTSGCILVVTPRFVREPKLGIMSVHNVPGHWVQFIAPLTGTPNSDWFNDTFTYEDKVRAEKEGRSLYALFDEEMSGVPAGCNGVVYHPYMSAAGERAPFTNTNARGNFFGLNLHSDRNVLHRAVYEGMAFSNKHCLDAYTFPVKDVCLTGGGTNSPVWCQIFADVLDVPIKLMSGTEYGAKGAAWNAAWAAGIFPTHQAARDAFCRVDRVYTPIPENVAVYKDLYEVYKEIPYALFPAWKKRSEFLEKHGFEG
ncbi:FGGY-family carbohydrate kinase [Propionicicella superfundia]|uniref:FGGY-family carbohydrate kinase n=1 Tax=Propionicicella superfundia TaxID=348582 RepID=UPI0003FF8B53|nr:FGGY-family carbohydrate kinase [Propionicicella superfundia]